MATTSKSWPWASTVEGWAFTSVKWAGGHDGSNGNPAGSLQANITGKNSTGNGYWYLSDTWANIFGINASDTVTGVRLNALDWRCQNFDYVDEGRLSDQSGTNANAVQYVGTSNLELWGGAQVTGTTSWADPGQQSQQTVPGADQAGSTTVEFRLYVYGSLQNNSSAHLRFLLDNLEIEIEHTAGRTPRSASMCPILGG